MEFKNRDFTFAGAQDFKMTKGLIFKNMGKAVSKRWRSSLAPQPFFKFLEISMAGYF
jgi:hypothetical protein